MRTKVIDRDWTESHNLDSEQVLTRYQGVILAWFLLWSMIAVNFFCFLLIDQKRGLLVTSFDIPRFSFIIATVQCILFLTAIIARNARFRRLQWLVLLVTCVPIVAGLMMLAEDWFVSLLVIIANLMCLFFFYRRQHLMDGVRGTEKLDQWSSQTLFKPSEFWISLISIILIVCVSGFELSDSIWALYAVAFILVPLTVISIAVTAGPRFRSGLRGPFLEWIILIVLPFFGYEFLTILVLLAFRQLVRILRLLNSSQRIQVLVNRLFEVPAQLMVVGFTIIIIFGSIALSFPSASASGSGIETIDALFTATSATCVTGLIVLDTPHDFSFFGQMVILLLIQLGGLGFMTVSTFAVQLIGKQLGLPHQWALASIIEENDPRSLLRMVRFIVLITVFIEGLAAAILTIFAVRSGHLFSDAVWFGVFHAISGFCNAGFALQSDSLESFSHSYLVLSTISVLIIAGGLGFSVLWTIWERIWHSKRRKHVNLHTRLAVIGTIVLLASGTLLFLVLEWNGVLSELNPAEKLLASFFQSTTTRTAGFNSVSMAGLHPATIFLFIVFMFIGACPGSTAGGVKVTTVMVLGLSIVAIIRGRRNVEFHGRTIPHDVVFRAMAIITLSLIFLTVLFFSLLLTQQQSFQDLAFETISAFGTVGLSLGITPELNSFGKFLIIMLMFIGRLGPLTLALILKVRQDMTYRFPYEDVSVG